MTTKKLLVGFMTMFAVIPAASFGQTPDGSDIKQAIPVYFGQTANDTGDRGVRPVFVYSITLSKGQQLAVVANSTVAGRVWALQLLRPSALTVNSSSDVVASYQGGSFQNAADLTLTYEVPAAGTYYIVLYFNSGGIKYSLQVNAVGVPLSTPNPTQAGCLNGQVDYITYSLQLIAASLPDEASVGGTKLCATCTVKPPAYPQLAAKMETAMGLNVGVSACYDAAGSIFQIKLLHP